MNQINYQKTLNLPSTGFPMKANLVSTEPGIQQGWEKTGLYRRIREKSKGRPKYILHDGPPYANGDIHIGTAFNKLSKDIVVKYKTMRGYDSPFVPGWDCHGMPIEHQVEEEIRAQKKDATRLEIRSRCRKHAGFFVNVQRKQFQRLGVLADWERPYLTMSNDYEATIVGIFAGLMKKGFIYQGKRPVYWCIHHRTALAEAEVEYDDHASPSIYVRFPADETAAREFASRMQFQPAGKRVSVLVWTTTPWTLPGNAAVALHPELKYVAAEVETGSGGAEILILAEDLLTAAATAGDFRVKRVLGAADGRELASIRARHPFVDRESVIILAGYVSNHEGTGCVHTAPGHGEEDYRAGLEYKLPVIMPVDEKGEFTGEGGEFAGMEVFAANRPIIERLRKEGNLLAEKKIVHSYPHCWRCRRPVIYRATEQWFLNVDHDSLREKALAAIGKVKWYPPASENRIRTMVEGRPDWCLSRQRNWGVPIPVFYCEGCGRALYGDDVFATVEKLVREKSADVWFEYLPEKILPAGTVCSGCGGAKFRPETDILDVWFDSAISHLAVLPVTEGLAWPSNLYLEGSDQHRGWFQVSLLTAMAIRKQPPYRVVLTHGYTVDGEGKKMSKSRGNFITSDEAVSHYGADVIRLWAASENFQNDIRFSEEIMARVTDGYRRIRNTCRFLIGNLYDFEPEKNGIDDDEFLEIDRWILSRLYLLSREVTESYEEFSFYRAYQAMYNYCTVILSSFYLDVLKDRLYTSGKDSLERRSAQTALYRILSFLARALAPILSFTMEEVWFHLRKLNPRETESVHLAPWPEIDEKYFDAKLEGKWKVLLDLRGAVMKRLEELREREIVGNSLQAKVTLNLEDPGALGVEEKLLASIFIVSRVALEKAGTELPGAEVVELKSASETDQVLKVAIKVEKAEGKKCERCWNWSETVGRNEEHPGLCRRCAGVVSEQRS